MSSNPKDMWKKAEEIAKSRKSALEIWTELKSWAVKEKEPVAMKAAIFEFLALHGTNPEAAPLLPEIFRDASHISSSLPKKEKELLIELADKASLALKFSYNSPIALNPTEVGTNMPLARNRPSLMLSLQPSGDSVIFTPLIPTLGPEGLIRARDTMLSVNDQVLATTMLLPPLEKEPMLPGDVPTPPGKKKKK